MKLDKLEQMDVETLVVPRVGTWVEISTAGSTELKSFGRPPRGDVG